MPAEEYTKESLESKIKGLTLARKTTVDETTSFKLDMMINQFHRKYTEVTRKTYTRP